MNPLLAQLMADDGQAKLYDELAELLARHGLTGGFLVASDSNDGKLKLGEDDTLHVVVVRTQGLHPQLRAIRRETERMVAYFGQLKARGRLADDTEGTINQSINQ